MTEEKLINGYKCCFQDSRKAPECNFISIPIVHDARYNDVKFAIEFTPEEKETFGKRIQLIGSSTHPIEEGYFAVSVFTFAYMEDDDLEFIKQKAKFFFFEENTLISELTEKKNCEILKLYSNGYSKLVTTKLIKDYFNIPLHDAKNSTDLISEFGCVNYDLSKISKEKRTDLLKELESNNVKYDICHE